MFKKTFYRDTAYCYLDRMVRKDRKVVMEILNFLIDNPECLGNDIILDAINVSLPGKMKVDFHVKDKKTPREDGS